MAAKRSHHQQPLHTYGVGTAVGNRLDVVEVCALLGFALQLPGRRDKLGHPLIEAHIRFGLVRARYGCIVISTSSPRPLGGNAIGFHNVAVLVGSVTGNGTVPRVATLYIRVKGVERSLHLARCFRNGLVTRLDLEQPSEHG